MGPALVLCCRLIWRSAATCGWQKREKGGRSPKFAAPVESFRLLTPDPFSLRLGPPNSSPQRNLRRNAAFADAPERVLFVRCRQPPFPAAISRILPTTSDSDVGL